MRYMPGSIINIDHPAHTRVRKLLIKKLNKNVIEYLHPFVEKRNKLLKECIGERDESLVLYRLW
jgi:cytochrome P450